MKLEDAVYAYNPNTNQILVGELSDIHEGLDWTKGYQMTGGAVNTEVQELDGEEVHLRVMSDFIGVVVRDGVDVASAHREFLKIEEYCEAIPLDMEHAAF